MSEELSPRNPVSSSSYDLEPPDAGSLIESLRSFGYDLSTALADLVDNSITAGATRIWIDFHWAGETSAISVTDDGSGLSEERLRRAMRAGSRNPLEVRDSLDLGRFGLGLKTASFSQCRRLTVRTKPATKETSTRCWDIDHVARVGDWQLLREADDAAERYLKRLTSLDKGTVVLWQKMDRLVRGNDVADDRDQQRFLQRATAVREHLAMVFHLLIGIGNGVQLFLNDVPVEAWDPFLIDEAATQRLPVSRLAFQGAQIIVEPFILPHHSKLSKAVEKRAEGPRGSWNSHQGFFVYRNRRLLVPGEWLGFGWAKEEHYKLARIRVDIPNSLDEAWQIDVTKSKASPPPALRDELRHIGERARQAAKRVYTHRGARLTPAIGAERVFLWEPVAKHDLTFYRLNRDHPLLQHVMASSEDPDSFRAFLKLIEETIPLPLITIQNTEQPNRLPGPFQHTPDSQIREVMTRAYDSLVSTGYGPAEATDRLRTIWPFELFPAIIETLRVGHAAV